MTLKQGSTISPKMEILKKIFDNAQNYPANHTKLVRKLMTLYETVDLNEFETTFIICLKNALAHSVKVPALRTLEFVARFCGTLEREISGKKNNENNESGVETIFDGEDEEPMSPFIHAVFEELLKNSDNKVQCIRMRVCYTVKKILQQMGSEASIDSELCDLIYARMLDRLKDKSPSVRVQAVTSLERLQDPSDPNCMVIRAFLYHLQMDCSAEVRRAVLLCLGRSKQTLPAICGRIHDVRDIVRKQAYVCLSKVSIRAHTIQRRETILAQGLKDRSEAVRNTVEKELLRNWLENCQGSYIEFLHALDLENSSELPDKALKSLFKGASTFELVKVLQLDSRKLIPAEKLTVEMAFYWRCLGEWLEKEDQLNLVVPELSLFCEYIKSNMEILKDPKVLDPWNYTKEDFIMVQLIELSKVFDFGDETGRENLKKLLLQMLASTHVRFKLVSIIIKVFNEVVPDVDTRLQLLTEVVSDIHEPLVVATPVQMSDEERRQREYKIAQLRVKKNILLDDMETAVKAKEFLNAEKINNDITKLKDDIEALTLELPSSTAFCSTGDNKESESVDPKIIAKCLQIIYDMVMSSSVKTFTPQLRSIKESFVVPNLQVEHPVVQVLALQCMGAFGCIDQETAGESMFFFCFHMGTNFLNEVVLTALKGVLDFLFKYGLKALHIKEIYDEKPSKKVSSKRTLMRHSTVQTIDDSVEGDTVNESSEYIKDDEDDEFGGKEKKQEHLFAMITSLLDKEQGQTLHCVVEGLCKLLSHGQIKSPNFLSRLILLWFNPVFEDDNYLRQFLGLFFKMFATSSPVGQEILEQSFLPAISTVLNAPPSSPLVQVNVESVAKFLLDLTKCGVNRFSAGVNVHNNLAIQICNEIIKETFEGYTTELIQILCHMELSLDESQRESLEQMLPKISQLCPDKSSTRALEKFKNMIKADEEMEISRANLSTLQKKRSSSRAMSEEDPSICQSSVSERSKALRTESRTTIPSASSDIIIPESEGEDESDTVFGDDEDR